ncbi:MAG: antibiotic biosynthesis monooxygenase [Planctomycetes bacterium]|nr:antibiotic biosynthesis monooxygenase [Planctomycetota bacterium]
MADAQIALIAKVRAKEGQTKALAAELTSMIEPTRAEAGCIKYDLHVSADDEALFMFYEIWRSKEDLDLHLETPHLQGLLSKMGTLVEGDLDVSMWKLV